MREVYGHVAARGHKTVDEVDVDKLHAPAHLVVGNMEELYGLDGNVGEVAVETPLYVKALHGGELRETFGKVLAHHPAAVAHYLIYKEVCRIGQHIERAQGQERHKREQRQHDMVSYGLLHMSAGTARSVSPSSRSSTRRMGRSVLSASGPRSASTRR